MTTGLPCSVSTSEPSIHIYASSDTQPSSDSSISVKVGDNIIISGVPQNLQGLVYWSTEGSYPPSGYYNAAFFFDQNFSNNNLCGNNELTTTGPWIMKCTAKVIGSTYFYVEIYANGKTYRSNTVTVKVKKSKTSSITVISPNGGEIWQVGSVHRVSWSNNTTKNVRVELLKGNNYITDSGALPRISSGYDITLSSSLQAGSDYKIRVTSLDSSGAANYEYYDDSDSYFTITAPTTNTIKNNISTTGSVLGAESFHFTQLLQLGSVGNEVMELQIFLTGAGYDVGIADGKFGAKTQTAIAQFQTKNGLNGDGVVGTSTRALLNK